MKYILEPSLEHIALIKIVVTLWNQNDVRALLTEFSQNQLLSQLSTEWKKIGDRIMEKVSHLLLPEILKEKIRSVIKPIGKQIFKWIKYHCINYLCIDLPYELCWTPQGTIDRKKTAAMLIKDEELDICKRYKIACIYCLEDDILELWSKIPETLKICFSFPGDPFNTQKSIARYWTNIIQGSDNAILSYKDALKCFAPNAEKEVVEYFLHKISPNETKEFLVTTAKTVLNSDVLCLLFSHMDEEQQREFLESKSYEVLRCFLYWPSQSFFTEVANQMWDFLLKKDFDSLLRMILIKVRIGYKDCNYKNLFVNFWQASPDAFKSYILSDGRFLTYLFNFEDTDYLKLFLQNLSLTEKKKLIYYNQGQDRCANLISVEKWELLGIVIQECLSSQDEMMKFDREFEGYLMDQFSQR